MIIRNPSVAGQFYEEEGGNLLVQVKNCLENSKDKVLAKGIVTPHAGLMYSGKVAGKVWGKIRMPDTLIMIGPNHRGSGSDFTLMDDGWWNLPLGKLRIDGILSKRILTHSQHLERDDFAQDKEHSLEVQTPFIQFLSDKTEIVPIMMKHYLPDDNFLKICERIGEAIADSIIETNVKATIVASTDFSHYVPADLARENDIKALNAIVELDAEKLFQVVNENKISMCGYAAVAVMIYAVKRLGAEKGELMDYMNSGDITGDYSSVVGYGGVIIP